MDVPLVHSFADDWSRPGLTNFLGSVQVDSEPTALSHPIFYPVSSSEERTCFLTINDELLAATGLKTDLRWCPFRAQRLAEWDGWRIETQTTMPWDVPAIVQRIIITNMAPVARRLELGVRLSGRVVLDEVSPWGWGCPVVSTDTYELLTEHGLNPKRTAIGKAGWLWHETKNPKSVDIKNRGWSAQVLRPAPERWLPNGDGFHICELPMGTSFVLDHAMALGTSSSVADIASRAVRNVPRLLKQTERRWRALWRGIFRKGNKGSSGHLPDLELPAETAIVGASSVLDILMLRRYRRPFGYRYNVLTPRRTEAGFYIWDWALAASALTRFDPIACEKQLELVWRADFRNNNQYNIWTGKSCGWTYSADISCLFYAVYCLWQSWGGGASALQSAMKADKKPRTLLSFLEELAFDFRRLWNKKWGLADYGSKTFLLECVTTYAHMVAGLNAASAGMLLQLAECYDLLERVEDARSARHEADSLIENILGHLYVEGQGYFRCVQPDGRGIDCRSAYDVGMVLWTIGDRLPKKVQEEIVAFFWRELHTPTWMRALSSRDQDAAVSGMRADHQYSGSYGTWPAMFALGLLKIGRHDVVAKWLPGLALTARQGPFGQAHWDERIVPPTGGGATKVSEALPQGMHWADIGGALFFSLVEEFYRKPPSSSRSCRGVSGN